MRRIKQIKWMCLLVFGLILVGCSKEENGTNAQLSKLKSVRFSIVEDQIVKSTPTGKVVGGKREYLNVVKKQQVLNPIELLDGSNLDVIFPGSILRGDAFMEGEYSPVVVKNAKEVTISATLQGVGLPVTINAYPVTSSMRQSVNDLINANRNKIDYNNVPAYLSYVSNQVTTTESFNKTFKIHAKANILAGIVKAKFNFEDSKITFNQKKYVLIKVRQQFYNITVDPKAAEDWGELINLGEYEPVYVSSVDYGRVAFLLIESSENTEKLSNTVKGAISAMFKPIGGNIRIESKQELIKLFEDKKIRIMVTGGPLSKSKAINDYDSFKDFLENPSPKDLVNSSAPIGYKIRTVRDNKEVEVRAAYTEYETDWKE